MNPLRASVTNNTQMRRRLGRPFVTHLASTDWARQRDAHSHGADRSPFFPPNLSKRPGQSAREPTAPWCRFA